ncbi:DUF6461 domain-containing protein [Streptomyces sp. NPDC005803]|uniref:DUF6461 domain-containing protein n=1 Tax=Streptomyces sp. NPDC005803 TaxID=3154297 RepID=UPI0033D2677F
MIAGFTNINTVGTFLWAEDPVLRLCFDPMFPEDRWGAEPDELLDMMRRMGFPSRGGGSGTGLLPRRRRSPWQNT